MATADRLEGSIGSGIQGIKQHMKDMSVRVKETNERATRLEEENEKAKQTFIQSYGRQKALQDRLVMVEEKLEKNKERIAYLTKKVLEKEKFYIESQNFNKSLKVSTPDEGEVQEMEERLRVYKDIYNKNYERYQTARNKKVALEQELEHSELKSHEAMRRVEGLKTELEYNQVEEVRRAEGCKEAIDAAFRCEKSCMDLRHGLDVIMKRKEEANKKINKLEKEVSKAENAKETLNFERRRMEATIKECLINIKNQQQHR